MNPIKVETTVDEAAVKAIPALRPFLGERVELTARHAEGRIDAPAKRTLTLDALLERRVDAPVGTPPLTDADIQRAIIEGALDGIA